jgi:hypothetical protein
MKDFNDFLIIGGDLRFVYAAARLARAGYSCSLFGFDALHDDVRGELSEPWCCGRGGIRQEEVQEIISQRGGEMN